MGYYQHYNILNDEHLAPGFNRAVMLAKAGPRLLREAYKLEEEVDKVTGFNRVGWALIGGSYLNRDANDQTKPVANTEASGNSVGEVQSEEVDDGGWSVEKEGMLTRVFS